MKTGKKLVSIEFNKTARINDIARYRELDFVVGYSICQSNNSKHLNCTCKAFEGSYPKNFEWDGCDYDCQCHTVAILKAPDEVDKQERLSLKVIKPKAESRNTEKSVPDGFLEYINVNKELLKNTLPAPLFISSNFIDGDINKGLDYEKLGIKSKKEDKNTMIAFLRNLF